MGSIKVIAILFSICIISSFGQSLSYNNSAEDFQLTTELLYNANPDQNAKELIQSVQDVYAQILQVRKDVNRTVMETNQVYAAFNDINTTEMCNNCKNYINSLRLDANTTDKFTHLKETLTELCNNGSNNTQICYYSVADFADVFYDASLYQVLDPVRFCQDFSYCPYTIVYESVDDYATEILADKPATAYPTVTNTSNYKFLHLTDVHVDRLYEPGAIAVCASTEICCRVQTGMASDPSQAAQYWGTLASCDIPYRTFEGFLQYAAANHEFDFILWTGDNLPHDIYSQSVEISEGYTSDLTNMIKQYFPNTIVYPMFGNHEVYPMSQYDFINNSTSWLTIYLGQIWGDWISADAINDFIQYGYYAEDNEQHNTKVIALNTEVCDTYNFWLIANPTDPLNQLAWLRQELYDSESRNQSVIIMGHIPPGYSSCDSEWGARYRALIDRFTNIVRGQFFGHAHNDEIEIVRSFADNSSVGVVWISPSSTTFANLNPSYRIFQADSETNFLVNFYQYRLNLSKYNADTSLALEFDIAYTALDEYSLPDLSFGSVDTMVKNMYDNTTLAQLYIYNFFAGGTPVDAATLDPNVTHTYSCHAQYSVFVDSLNCLGHSAGVTDLLYFAAQLLPGEWFYDKSAH